MKGIIFFILTTFLFVNLNAQNESKEVNVCVKNNEMRLYNLVMEYREQNNLPSIPLSASLCFVAQSHCKDLVENYEKNKECNIHSWKTCCYSPNHSNAKCMWYKPTELTNYKGLGYEIAFYVWHSDDANYTVTPEEALEGWQQSTGHNDLLLNRSIWKDSEWKAIGIGIYKGYATIWFGEKTDTEKTPSICN